MNTCTLTAKIMQSSQLLLHQGKLLSTVLICLKNSKKQLKYYRITAIAKNKISDYLFEAAAINSNCILQGFIYINKNNILNENKTKRFQKKLYIKVTKIYNLFY